MEEQIEKAALDIEKLKRIYSAILIRKLKKEQPIWEEIFKIGTENSAGDLIIAGGFIYRPIIEAKYRRKTKREDGIIDVDFIASQLSREPYSPRPLGWAEQRTIYGNPSYVKGNHYVVLNDMHTFHSIMVSGRQPTIENLLDLTPLDIQSIGWIIKRDDLFAGELVGDKGILAIYNRQVRMNNREEAVYEIRRRLAYEAQLDLGSEEFNLHMRQFNIEDLLKKFIESKAKDLRFTPIPFDSPQSAEEKKEGDKTAFP